MNFKKTVLYTALAALSLNMILGVSGCGSAKTSDTSSQSRESIIPEASSDSSASSESKTSDTSSSSDDSKEPTTEAAETPTPTPAPVNILTVTADNDALHITLSNASSDISSPKAAIWSEANGQDDLQWSDLTETADGTWSADIAPERFPDAGIFNIHIYFGNDYITGASADWESDRFGYPEETEIYLDENWEFASFSSVHSSPAVLYLANTNRKNIIVALNAGHGSSESCNYSNLSHPDGTPKVTGGSTAEGAVYTPADNTGMTFSDGTAERDVTFQMAQICKEKLLAAGYDVLMLRNSEDVSLDVIGRTIIANNIAACHIAIHWDGDELDYDKGAYYMSVPDALKSMYPVSTIWSESDRLGDCVISGLSSVGTQIWDGNPLATDLMQTSYSTIPSIDVEFGNQSAAHDDATLSNMADGLVNGLDLFFGQ